MMSDAGTVLTLMVAGLLIIACYCAILLISKK